MSRYRRSKAKGNTGEQIARLLMQRFNVAMWERIATPVHVVRRRDGGQQVIYADKVSGDWRGIMADGTGRRVLAEVKYPAENRNLRYSDLKEHQIEALDTNHNLGGVSLLVYIHPQFSQVESGSVMRWPIEGFEPYQSISPEQARALVWDGRS